MLVRSPIDLRTWLPPLAAIAVAVAMAGCAQSGAKLLPEIGQRAPDTYKPGQAYQLSSEELSLDCKKITGRMQIRILQTRDATERTGGSVTSRTIQSTVTPVLGGTSRGADPSRDRSRDRAWLEAMNAQLAAKKCPTFDLDDELRPRPLSDTPTPVPQATPGATPKKR